MISFSTDEFNEFKETYADDDVVFVSARDGLFVKELLGKLENKLYEQYIAIHAKIPYDKGNLLSQIYSIGKADMVDHMRDGVEVEARIPTRIVAQYNDYLIKEEEENNEEMVI